ncbi:protease 3 precursor [bacterium BMS3Abin05]|nr:protease 3 precursor [bacterium BMS3Abin05]GBE27551.1 protease 3 precursor [bacterium BMS3Bbin03]HDK35451.1 insulinase family protein [Bacteroidota bacterium]HDL78812.1 insulinase family protein [Bacteroidota bacterium]HDZ12927.1 insulinase family protein [Bacteroidota bacterium]
MSQNKNVNESSLYKKTVLSNGIRVVSEKIPYVRSVSIGIWIEAGTRDETEETNGIAHFSEHMLFKGTKKRNTFEIADALESLGGGLNAFTGKELTSYYAHVLDEHLDMAMDVLTDLILNPLLDPKELEKEKNVVLEEIKDFEDALDELIFDFFFQDLFSPHPISFSTLGKKEVVQGFKRDDLIQFMRSHYSANRIVIAAAGNLEHQQLVDLTGKYFSSLNSFSTRKLKDYPEDKPARRERTGHTQLTHICVGCRAIPYTHEKKYPLLLTNTILGAGMSSRLFQTLREQYGLAYSVFSFSDFYLDTGVFGVYVGTDEKNIDQSIELIINEFNKLRDKKLKEEELTRRQSQLKGNLLLGLESTSNRMDRLAKMEIYLHEFHTLDDVIHEIDQVRLKDVIETAETFFTPEKVYQTIVKPNHEP